MTIRFRVYGTPKPAGSKRAFYNAKLGRALIVDDCKKSKDWKTDVQAAAIEAYDGDPLHGPLSLSVEFIMPRTRAHYRSNGEVKRTAPLYHTVKPDTTKLLRGTEDALTGIVWADDACIARQTVVKRYGDRPGAEIEVRRLEATP